MAKRIVYNYEIPLNDDCEIVPGCWGPRVELPVGAQILKVGTRGTRLFLWALVDPDSDETEKLKFLVCFTGVAIAEDLLDGYEFLDTVLVGPQGLVFHVYKAPSSSG